MVFQAWRLKNLVIIRISGYICRNHGFPSLEAEKPGNLPGYQDTYVEIVVFQAWRLKNLVIYLDFRMHT